MKPQYMQFEGLVFQRAESGGVIISSEEPILLSNESISALVEFRDSPEIEALIVDWSAMPKWANWVAEDEGGAWYYYTEQPIRDGLDWIRDPDNSGHSLIGIIPEAFVPKFSGPWTESLVERPKEQTIDPDAIAPGHNPNKLTNAQVGVQDGWRLLDLIEHSDWNDKCVPDAEFKQSDHKSEWMMGCKKGSFPYSYNAVRTRLSKSELAKLHTR